MQKVFTTSSAITVALVMCTAFLSPPDLQKSIERGNQVYLSYCRQCHLANGAGKPNTYPPLAKSDFLEKSPETLIKFMLTEQNDTIIVNNVKYKNKMASQAYLSDEQIADVLNYIRNSWGNSFPKEITPDQVKALRK